MESSNVQNKQLQERTQALARQVAELLAEKAATTKVGCNSMVGHVRDCVVLM